MKNKYPNFRIELLILDDNSNDGTEQLPELNQPWIYLTIRKENRGLSQAIINGLKLARHDIVVVMDADLSHPPEKIPEMIQHLNQGADFVIGSRYVTGASIDGKWGIFRCLIVNWQPYYSKAGIK
ncbi:dolichyl-phosphate beta-D-mannosyltransferase [Thioploca ingrica]|uniref:Dolichyl-phosphate beta-D-mannosyltransferase n=1 Tax=Thioploca ingrica TaxID=40754 RepID=A0A090AAA8_9GAMM|nr:dolichyl-phosphate beta-D-mannosyltransferase [Thioploca ingrica]